MKHSGEGRDNQGHSRRSFLLKGGAATVAAGVGIASWRAGLLRTLLGNNRSGLKQSTFITMGTFLELSLPQGTDSTARKAAEALRQVEERMSFFDKDSELSRLNTTAAHGWFSPSNSLAQVVAQSLKVHQMTGGAFDPTIGPLMAAWGLRGDGNSKLPNRTQLKNSLEKVGLHQLAIDGERLGFKQERLSLDLGGIAKGYGVDRAAKALAAAGVAGLVNAGGDIRASGPAADGRPWQIGVRDPINPERIFATIPLVGNGAIATSGTYLRGAKVGGRTVPHILDPRTGEPAGQVVSATVVAPNATVADAIATACVVMEPKEALELLERTANIQGLLVVKGSGSGSSHRIEGTSGLKAKILHQV